MQQNLEIDDEYNKYAPSADYNSASGRIFRNKKFTKKRHESKTRRSEPDPSNVCCSDEDYPQAAKHVEDLPVQKSIPKIMMTINQTIKKMSLKDNNSFSCIGESGSIINGSGSTGVVGDSEIVGVADIPVNLEVEEPQEPSPQPMNPSNTTSSICNLQPLGKRRRHRRKQQYKRMAVDVLNDKQCLLLKIPTSNSSEDSGIGKRKRNILVTDNNDPTVKGAVGGKTSVSATVPTFVGQPINQPHQQQWPSDDNDVMMMDCDDMESSSVTKLPGSVNSQGILITEEESGGESDTQNDDIESLSDHNQDADDEESDYYNNDSSTTSLSESSFTILNPSKKFIPVHSREIRSGRRRLKNTNISTIENEELSKFLQSPKDAVLKVCLSSEKERQDFINVASLYSLSYEEGVDPEERVWIQVTKTPKTTTQRRNDFIKSGDRSTFTNFSEGSTLAPLFDTVSAEKERHSDECIHGIENSSGNIVSRSRVCVTQLVNSKRIKKGC